MRNGCSWFSCAEDIGENHRSAQPSLAIQLMILEICHLKLQNDVFLKSLHLHPKRMAKKINRGWQKLVSVSVVCRPRYLHPVVSLLGKHKDRIIMRCSKEHWQS